MLLLDLQLHELPEWATSYICFFTQYENKKYRNPALLALALYSSLKTKDELDWDLGIFILQGSSSRATLGATVQISEVSLMITEEYFSLGNVEEVLLFHYFQICPTVYEYSMENAVGHRFANSSIQLVVRIGLFLFFPTRIISFILAQLQ